VPNVDSLIYYSLMSVLPIDLKILHSNPIIPKFKAKLELYLCECKNPLLTSYIKSVLSLSLYEIASKYGKDVSTLIVILPKKGYKGLPGIYQFCNGKESYLGSSKNLFTRKQHKTMPLLKHLNITSFTAMLLKYLECFYIIYN